jgi:hypothetical protein
MCREEGVVSETKELKVTKGPWITGIQYDGEFGCPILDASGREIAEAKGENEEECAANALLIAAAPLLCETLDYARVVANREGWTDLVLVISEALSAAR